ncbi:DNA repair protein rad52, partial [Rhizopus stolonifer]
MKQEPFTPTEQEIISNVLKRSLGPEWINQRSGPSGRLTYIEGKTAINLANEIFGFNGWCSEIKDTTVDFVDVTSEGRTNIGVSVTIKITLKDGTFHEDIGYGSSENAKTKASAYEKARKQAVTDATKRALRSF